MGFLRNVVTDLVEKRLWPVALLLVVALAAVPVLLGRGGAPEPAVTAAASAAPASPPAARAQIAVDVPVPANRERKGKLRNPFKPRAAKAAATPSATAPTPTPAPAPSDAPSKPTDMGPAGSGPGSLPTDVTPPAVTPPADPVKPDTTAPKADPLDLYRISLRFGRTGKVTTRRDLARLTPLPTVDNPFFVFLGVLKGGTRAVFLVSDEAKPTGDGICKPRKTDCQTIELRVGDTQYFDIEREGGPVQYELELLSIRKEDAGSTSEAVAARARASKAGGKVLQQADPGAVDGIDGYRFSRSTGLLERTPVSSRAGADEDGADADPAAAPAPAVADPAAGAQPALAAAAAAAQPAVADAGTAGRKQDKRTRAAVRAVVRGVGRALSALR